VVTVAGMGSLAGGVSGGETWVSACRWGSSRFHGLDVDVEKVVLRGPTVLSGGGLGGRLVGEGGGRVCGDEGWHG